MTPISKNIAALKAALGDQVCIVGHHYQHDDIIQHCDITGDSLELARKVAHVTAPHIVFCGVFFMAESAALLAREGQSVHIPDASAQCFMSQMTPAPLLEKVMNTLHTAAQARGQRIIPLAYVNTSLAVKDVVGRYGGAVCTSANAKTMLRWALEEVGALHGDGGQVVFVPDKNLGQNTAVDLGLGPDHWHILNVRKGGTCLNLAAAAKKKMLLWPGCCAIHAKFKQEHMTAMRHEHPQCQVLVHPECSHSVVSAADGAGSTSYLIKKVEESPKGSTIIVGTEGNLVERLRDRHAGHCTVIPLRAAYCSDMAKITEEKLLEVLNNIKQNSATPVSIPQNQVATARSSLERMLDACAKAGV